MSFTIVCHVLSLSLRKKKKTIPNKIWHLVVCLGCHLKLHGFFTRHRKEGKKPWLTCNFKLGALQNQWKHSGPLWHVYSWGSNGDFIHFFQFCWRQITEHWTITTLLWRWIWRAQSSVNLDYVWARPHICSICAGKDATKPVLYHPTSIISNVVEKVVHSQLVRQCLVNRIISGEVFGFFKGRSAELQLLSSLEVRRVHCVLLNAAKAFESVDHTALLSIF